MVSSKDNSNEQKELNNKEDLNDSISDFISDSIGNSDGNSNRELNGDFIGNSTSSLVDKKDYNNVVISDSLENLLNFSAESKKNDNSWKELEPTIDSIEELFKIILTPNTFAKIMFVLTKAFEIADYPVESYWFLIAKLNAKDPSSLNTIIDILVPTQNISHAFVSVSKESVLASTQDVRILENLSILGWGHSHANFSVFFSGTDWINQERIFHETSNYIYSINDKSRIKYSYGMTFNNKGEIFAQITFQKENEEIVNKRIPVYLKIDDADDLTSRKNDYNQSSNIDEPPDFDKRLTKNNFKDEEDNKKYHDKREKENNDNKEEKEDTNQDIKLISILEDFFQYEKSNKRNKNSKLKTEFFNNNLLIIGNEKLSSNFIRALIDIALTKEEQENIFQNIHFAMIPNY